MDLNNLLKFLHLLNTQIDLFNITINDAMPELESESESESESTASNIGYVLKLSRELQILVVSTIAYVDTMQDYLSNADCEYSTLNTSSLDELHERLESLITVLMQFEEHLVSTKKIFNENMIHAMQASVSNLLVNIEDLLAESKTNLKPAKFFASNVDTLLEKVTDAKREYQLLRSLIDHEKHKLEKLTNEISIEIKELGSMQSKSKDEAEEILNDLNNLYFNTQARLESKEVELNHLIEAAAQRTVSSDYLKSATEEQKSANRFRWGSIACMVIIIGIVGYMLYESTQASFDLESSLFRMLLVFIISVPAAYLSKESSKHRQKQYMYHQMALELNALSPFVSSLPADMQHELKAKMVGRLFGSSSQAQVDSFPLNPQELITSVIENLAKKKEKNSTAT